MKTKFKIKGLDCAKCAAELERAILKIEGVQSASISFMTEKLVVEYNEAQKDEILKNIEKVVKKEEPDVSLKEV